MELSTIQTSSLTSFPYARLSGSQAENVTVAKISEGLFAMHDTFHFCWRQMYARALLYLWH